MFESLLGFLRPLLVESQVVVGLAVQFLLFQDILLGLFEGVSELISLFRRSLDPLLSHLDFSL